MQGIDLKKRSDLHWARKIWHIFAVSIMFIIYRLAPNYVSMTLLVAGWLIFVPLDYMRLTRPKLNQWIIDLFGPIMRESEKDRIAGTAYLITGVLVVAVFFPRNIVSITLLFLAFADPVASAIGIKYGKDKIFGHKSLQGFLAAFFVCFLLCWLYLILMDLDPGRTLVLSSLAGLVAALAELIPVAKLDDNFTLPVISAIGLQILVYFFGFSAVLG